MTGRLSDEDLAQFRDDPTDILPAGVTALVSEIDQLRDRISQLRAENGELRARVLSEAEASWHRPADESPAGEPARWSHAVNAIISDSGKWNRWPENGPDGWWNARVSQSAIQGLYRNGFAVIAVTPEARSLIEADAGEAPDA